MRTFSHKDRKVSQPYLGLILTRNDYRNINKGGTKLVVNNFYLNSEGRLIVSGYHMWDENGKSFWNELSDLEAE